MMTKDEQILREMLWLHHGVIHMLYGDDGEMQCNTCMIDFVRDSVEQISYRFCQNGIQNVRIS
jgi:hypothetical protein